MTKTEVNLVVIMNVVGFFVCRTARPGSLTSSYSLRSQLRDDFSQDATTFLFAEAMAIISDRFDEKLALGAGPSGGVIVDLSEQWRMILFARSLAFTPGSTQLAYDIALEQAIDLSPGSGLRICLSGHQESGSPYNSVSVGYLIYF